MCAVICRKAIVMLSDANFLSPWCQSQSPRAQKRHFCVRMGSISQVYGLPEYKIRFFVRFWGPEPLFSDISSTKSAFLCALPAGKAERAGRAERTRRAERAGVLSSQKKEGGQSGHPLEFCISAVGLLTLCLQVSCKMQGGVLQTPL